jgi:hypothetical protein
MSAYCFVVKALTTRSVISRALEGFTLAERIVLDRYRKKAA